MTIRQIVHAPDKRLRQVSKPVESVNKELQILMDDMLETMYEANGIGLAAIQIGVSKQVIVMDLAHKEDTPQPQYFVNPKIVSLGEDKVPHEEGCLSLPGYFEEVIRAKECTVEFLDYNNIAQTIIAKEMFAVCIQHEIDHLKGILFVDHISRLKRDRIIKKLAKQQSLNV